MNYLELINKCLVELNYKQVNAFSELVKNDHKKIKNILNVINTEICGYDKWNFLLRKTTLNLAKGTSEIKNTINGRISTLMIDNKKYEFTPDYELFLTKSTPAGRYSILNDMLLFPKFDEDKEINVIYYTADNAVNPDSTEKDGLSAAEDESLIPHPFAEPILVYGACMRLKANPQHVKFSYWLNMYNNALATLKSKASIDAYYSPSVIMYRR